MSVLHEDGVGRGTCFGYEIRSQLDLHYLRSGTGMPLEIELGDQATAVPGDEPLLEWLPGPDLPFHGRLHRLEKKYLLWISGVGWFGIDPAGPRITVPPEADGVRREERIWGLPAILCLLGRGDLPLHAAAVEIDGRAVVLGAPRTFGKTTLAAAFARDGFRLLSEDLTCVRRGDEPHVVPGPAMLRLRHDVAEHLDVPHTTRLADADDRVHLAFTHDRRGDCEPLPIAGVMLLHRAESEIELAPAVTTEAIRDLWSLSFNVPTAADRTRCFDAITELATSVPVWNLHRPLTFSALRPTVERIVETVA